MGKCSNDFPLLPFADYPNGGRKRLGIPRNPYNARRGQGLHLMKKDMTGQRRCAYCGVDLTHD